MPRKEADWLTTAEENRLLIELGRHGKNILKANVRQNVAEAMRAARIRAAMIYAYVHTGLLVTEATRGGYSPEQLRLWEAVEYAARREGDVLRPAEGLRGDW